MAIFNEIPDMHKEFLLFSILIFESLLESQVLFVKGLDLLWRHFGAAG